MNSSQSVGIVDFNPIDSPDREKKIQMIVDLIPHSCDVTKYHFTQEVNFDSCDALILSGSPLFANKYQSMLESQTLSGSEYCAVHDVAQRLKVFPNAIYGICFGSQILAHVLGGSVKHTGELEVGYLDHELTGAGKSDPIFKNLPKIFFAAHSHYDIVDMLPNGNQISNSEVIATRNDLIHAWKTTLKDGRTHYGVQFHPEMSTPENAFYFVHSSRDDIVEAHGEAEFQELLQIPEHADYAISETIAMFLERL